MGSGRPLRITIAGAGVAGATLATLLAERGVDVTLLHDGKRPPLLVGESLIPAVVPLLRRLGIEDAVGRIGLVKPGVTFAWSPHEARLRFDGFAKGFPPYAYNVPRPAFDELLLERARRAGVREVRSRVEFARGPRSGEVLVEARRELGAEPIPGEPPDLIVDATGRRRAIARALGLAARAGPRNDVAHFAHFQGARWKEDPGQVLITRLRHGWSWGIPLPGRLSLGIVLDRSAAARLGESPEERLAAAIGDDPELAGLGSGVTRVTDVYTYSNYQIVTERGFGPGWVLVGDAFGFVDPMLSPGVFLAMHSAELLCRALEAPAARCAERGSAGDLDRPLQAYATRMRKILLAWMELVETLYDGSFLTLQRIGAEISARHPSALARAMERHVGLQFAGMASGVRTTSAYSRWLMRLLRRHGMQGQDPADLAVR